MVLDGSDLLPVWNTLVGRLDDAPDDAAAFIDLRRSLPIFRADRGIVLFAVGARIAAGLSATAGDGCGRCHQASRVHVIRRFLPNMPIEFLLQGSSVTLDMLYVVPGLPLPQPLPEHDVALVAVAESSENQAVLLKSQPWCRFWPRPGQPSRSNCASDPRRNVGTPQVGARRCHTNGCACRPVELRADSSWRGRRRSYPQGQHSLLSHGRSTPTSATACPSLIARLLSTLTCRNGPSPNFTSRPSSITAGKMGCFASTGSL